jgi:DNA polymerase-3 subunit beta
MKFLISKKDLVRAFSVAEGAVSKKPPIPVLGNVKIEANGVITFDGSDTMVSARSTATAKIDKQGSALVPAAQFLAAARAMPDGDVDVRIDGPRVVLAGGKARQRVSFSDAADFPELAACPGDLVDVPAALLAEAIGCVAHAASADESRANLAGVKVIIGGGRIRAVASNGHTLAIRDIECDAEGFDAFLPMQSLREIRKALTNASGSVGIGTDGRTVFVSTPDATLAVKLAGENFPPFESLVPKSADHRAVVAREAILSAFKRVMVASDDAASAVELVVSDGAIAMRMESTKGEASASDEVSCDYAGKGITIGVRGVYAVAALSVLTSDDVAIEMGSVLHPVRFVPAMTRDHLQLVMPSKL